jgi:rfaE bifunctional protein kinase chain/domain
MKKREDLKILVVGDIMLDKYVVGSVNRISPEAPVPIVDVTEEYYTLGGCGNVAQNLAQLGINTTCVAACGSGPKKDDLYYVLKLNNIQHNIVTDRGRPTTIKERIISENRQTQLLRIDRESRQPVNEAKIITEIKFVVFTRLFKPDIILVSDYNKGVVTLDVMKYITSLCNKIDAKLIIDPKPENQHAYIYGCYAITPNEQEYEKMYDINYSHFDNIIVTKGKEGVTIVKSRDAYIQAIPGESVEVYNVTGAGDSFVSIFSICIGMGIDIIQACRIANKCAAYVVTQPGTTVVPKLVFEQGVESIFPKGDYV